MDYRCASLGVVAALALAGCSIDNPLFGISSETADATGVGSSGVDSSGVTPTGEPVTSTSTSSQTATSVDPQTATSVDSQAATSVDSQAATSVDPQTSGSSDVGTSGSSDVGSSGSGVDTDVPLCGNDVVELGEECDDGNTNDEDGCSALCAVEMQVGICGSGVVEPGEECDEGPDNSDNGSCTLACKNAFCGDGLIHKGFEGCDDGANNSDSAACTTECKAAYCGDGMIQLGVEACDAGESNGKNLGGCNGECSGVISKDLLKIKVVGGVAANFSGALGGDDVCAKSLGPGFKALVADGVDRVASLADYDGSGQKGWVLAAHRGYANAGGELVFITGKERLLGVRNKAPAQLLKPLGLNGQMVWTGLGKTWKTAESCSGWTTTDLNVPGGVGNAFNQDLSFIGGATKACTNVLAIYCVQQPL